MLTSGRVGVQGGERQGGSVKKGEQQSNNGDDDSDGGRKGSTAKPAGMQHPNGKLEVEKPGVGGSATAGKDADGPESADGAFDVSKMKGKLAKKKMGGKGAKEVDKKKGEKKPKVKVGESCMMAFLSSTPCPLPPGCHRCPTV